MSPADTPIRLWDGAAPGSEDWTHHEIFASDLPGGYELVRNVTVPTLTPFAPDHATNRAVIVLPWRSISFSGDRTRRSCCRRVHPAVRNGVVRAQVQSRPHAQPTLRAMNRHLVDAFTVGIHDVASRVVPLAIADAQRALELVRSQGFEHITMIGLLGRCADCQQSPFPG